MILALQTKINVVSQYPEALGLLTTKSPALQSKRGVKRKSTFASSAATSMIPKLATPTAELSRARRSRICPKIGSVPCAPSARTISSRSTTKQTQQGSFVADMKTSVRSMDLLPGRSAFLRLWFGAITTRKTRCYGLFMRDFLTPTLSAAIVNDIVEQIEVQA